MRNKKLDVCCYIGRFQPYHMGHHNTIKKALELANDVIIILGSSKALQTIKNPFTAEDRMAMIKNSFSFPITNRIHFIQAEDFLYNEAEWVTNIQDSVDKLVYDLYGPVPDLKIGIIGYEKEQKTVEYKNQFKKWNPVNIDRFDVGDNSPLNATKIRELMFNGYVDLTKSVLTPEVFDYVKQFIKTTKFQELLDEYTDGIEYEHKFASYPKGWAINFITVDAVVIQSGYVLLVTRGQKPGLGSFALPGGHVNTHESIKDAMIRELYEETEISVPEKVLRGNIFCEKVFDHPDRSLRGRTSKSNARTVTHAYGIKLDDSAPLPNVNRGGGDDASGCWWFTFSEIENMKDKLFEDHYSIIKYMLARI